MTEGEMMKLTYEELVEYSERLIRKNKELKYELTENRGELASVSACLTEKLLEILNG